MEQEAAATVAALRAAKGASRSKTGSRKSEEPTRDLPSESSGGGGGAPPAVPAQPAAAPETHPAAVSPRTHAHAALPAPTPPAPPRTQQENGT